MATDFVLSGTLLRYGVPTGGVTPLASSEISVRWGDPRRLFMVEDGPDGVVAKLLGLSDSPSMLTFTARARSRADYRKLVGDAYFSWPRFALERHWWPPPADGAPLLRSALLVGVGASWTPVDSLGARVDDRCTVVGGPIPPRPFVDLSPVGGGSQ